MKLCVFFSLLLIHHALWAHTERLGLASGSTQGTYYQFGRDIQAVVARETAYGISVIPSSGSLENIFKLHRSRSTQLAIVQADVLAYFKSLSTQQSPDQQHQKLAKATQKSPDNPHQRIAKDLTRIYTLYDENVHLLARSAIGSVHDLNGKRIAVGKTGSGTRVTATVILKTLKINSERVPVGGIEALNQLKQGQLDAMFYVAGYPVELFQKQVSEADGLHLVPITNKELMEIYGTLTPIPAKTYDWQPESVTTLGVKAVLMTYNYQMRRCGQINHIAQAIHSQLSWLQEHGHPKWREVSLSQALPGWPTYACIENPPQQTEEDIEFLNFLKQIQIIETPPLAE